MTQFHVPTLALREVDIDCSSMQSVTVHKDVSHIKISSKEPLCVTLTNGVVMIQSKQASKNLNVASNTCLTFGTDGSVNYSSSDGSVVFGHNGSITCSGSNICIGDNSSNNGVMYINGKKVIMRQRSSSMQTVSSNDDEEDKRSYSQSWTLDAGVSFSKIINHGNGTLFIDGQLMSAGNCALTTTSDGNLVVLEKSHELKNLDVNCNASGKITVTGPLEVVESLIVSINSSGGVEFQQNITTPNVIVNGNSSGRITMATLCADVATLTTNSSGSLVVRGGEVRELTSTLNSSGSQAIQTSATTARVRVNGSGSFELNHVTTNLGVGTYGSGRATIYTTVQCNVAQKKLGSGNISIVKNIPARVVSEKQQPSHGKQSVAVISQPLEKSDLPPPYSDDDL